MNCLCLPWCIHELDGLVVQLAGERETGKGLELADVVLQTVLIQFIKTCDYIIQITQHPVGNISERE